MWHALPFVQTITMASKDPKISKQCTGGKKKKTVNNSSETSYN
jgi:hypothetical protein